jgi:hypothetical protein
LDVAARDCGGRGPYANSIEGRGGGVRCAEAVLSGATHDTARSENWLAGKSIARVVVKEGARKDLFGSETEK